MRMLWKKGCAVILTVVIFSLFLTLVDHLAGSQGGSMPLEESQAILSTISRQYSQALSDAVADLFYDSDYSVFVSDRTTFRSYKSVGGRQSWPISNADRTGHSVIDRGETVDWGRGSLGCMAYAFFFAYSVYGDDQSRDESEKVYVDRKDPRTWQDFEILIESQAQPGEHLRAYSYSNHRRLEHSMVFLCTGKMGNQRGFYAADYSGGCVIDKQTNQWVFRPSKDRYSIRFYTYKSFAKTWGDRRWFVYNTYENSQYADAPGETAA